MQPVIDSTAEHYHGLHIAVVGAIERHNLVAASLTRVHGRIG